MENVKTPISFMYLFWNQMVWLWNSFLPFSPSEPAITPTFRHFYPPPILTKHPIWYSIDTDFFIVLWGTLYGLHWWHFQNSVLFQEIVTHGEKHLVRLLPQHPIPFDILKTDLFNHFLVLLYHGTVKLNHLTRDDWIDLKWLCVDWYFPGQTAIIIRKFCALWHRQLPPMQWMLIQFLLIQQIIRQLNEEEEWWQRVCLIQIEDSKREEICVEDNSTQMGGIVMFSLYYTFTSPFFLYHYLIALF